jgi:hypothetical protein
VNTVIGVTALRSKLSGKFVPALEMTDRARPTLDTGALQREKWKERPAKGELEQALLHAATPVLEQALSLIVEEVEIDALSFLLAALSRGTSNRCVQLEAKGSNPVFFVELELECRAPPGALLNAVLVRASVIDDAFHVVAFSAGSTPNAVVLGAVERSCPDAAPVSLRCALQSARLDYGERDFRCMVSVRPLLPSAAQVAIDAHVPTSAAPSSVWRLAAAPGRARLRRVLCNVSLLVYVVQNFDPRLPIVVEPGKDEAMLPLLHWLPPRGVGSASGGRTRLRELAEDSLCMGVARGCGLATKEAAAVALSSFLADPAQFCAELTLAMDAVRAVARRAPSRVACPAMWIPQGGDLGWPLNETRRVLVPLWLSKLPLLDATDSAAAPCVAWCDEPCELFAVLALHTRRKTFLAGESSCSDESVSPVTADSDGALHEDWPSPTHDKGGCTGRLYYRLEAIVPCDVGRMMAHVAGSPVPEVWLRGSKLLTPRVRLRGVLSFDNRSGRITPSPGWRAFESHLDPDVTRALAVAEEEGLYCAASSLELAPGMRLEQVPSPLDVEFTVRRNPKFLVAQLREQHGLSAEPSDDSTPSSKGRKKKKKAKKQVDEFIACKVMLASGQPISPKTALAEPPAPPPPRALPPGLSVMAHAAPTNESLDAVTHRSKLTGELSHSSSSSNVESSGVSMGAGREAVFLLDAAPPYGRGQYGEYQRYYPTDSDRSFPPGWGPAPVATQGAARHEYGRGIASVDVGGHRVHLRRLTHDAAVTTPHHHHSQLSAPPHDVRHGHLRGIPEGMPPLVPAAHSWGGFHKPHSVGHQPHNTPPPAPSRSLRGGAALPASDRSGPKRMSSPPDSSRIVLGNPLAVPAAPGPSLAQLPPHAGTQRHSIPAWPPHGGLALDEDVHLSNPLVFYDGSYLEPATVPYDPPTPTELLPATPLDPTTHRHHHRGHVATSSPPNPHHRHRPSVEPSVGSSSLWASHGTDSDHSWSSLGVPEGDAIAFPWSQERDQ